MQNQGATLKLKGESISNAECGRLRTNPFVKKAMYVGIQKLKKPHNVRLF